MTPLNVDEIMQTISARAAVAGAEPSMPQLTLQQLLPVLREQQTVEPRPALIGRTRYERLWARINRIVRRVAAHAVEPAVAQQNEFNAATQIALEGLIEADAALRAAVIELCSARAIVEDGEHGR
jgi:hypothetical protein